MVDDAHWADTPSLLFLHYLARRLRALRVALALISRGGGGAPEADLVRRIEAVAQDRVLVLRPLSVGASAELVRWRLGRLCSDGVRGDRGAGSDRLSSEGSCTAISIRVPLVILPSARAPDFFIDFAGVLFRPVL